MSQDITTTSWADEDFLNIGAMGGYPFSWVYGIPPPQSWLPPSSVGMGLSPSGFTLTHQPYGFVPLISPASIVSFGAPTSTLGVCGTTYVNKTTFQDVTLPPLDEVASGINLTASYQSSEVGVVSQDFHSPVLGTGPLNELGGGNATPGSPVIRSPTPEPLGSGIDLAASHQSSEVGVASQDFWSLVLGTGPLNELGGGNATSGSPVTRSPTPEPLDVGLSLIQSFDNTSMDYHGEVTDDYSRTSFPQESLQGPEYIDLTGDDASDANTLDICVAEPHTDVKTTYGVRGKSETSDVSPKPDQTRSATKRHRDGEDDVCSPLSLSKSQKRRCMRTSPRRPAQDNELILDVRAISFTTGNGDEVESQLECGRWNCIFHKDDITAISFAVNSGNLTKLTFFKIDDNGTEGGWWLSEDIDGGYLICLSPSDIMSFVEDPKEACYQEYLYIEY